jgi:hypothetical protein
MCDPEVPGAVAAWRSLPARTRRRAMRLAQARGEPHPDPAVAAAARGYAPARLASLRRVPAALPALAFTLALGSLISLAIMIQPASQAAWPGPAVLIPLFALLAASLGGAWWLVDRMRLLPRRLRTPAAAGLPEPGQIIIRYRRRALLGPDGEATSLTLHAGDLDHSADEIVAALTAQSCVPVELSGR